MDTREAVPFTASRAMLILLGRHGRIRDHRVGMSSGRCPGCSSGVYPLFPRQQMHRQIGPPGVMVIVYVPGPVCVRQILPQQPPAPIPTLLQHCPGVS